MVVSPSNPASSASEVSRQIQLSSPVIAFATSSTSHKLPSSLPTLLLDSPLFLSLFSTSSSSSSSSDVPRRHHHLLGPTSVRQSDPAAILYSSGTTGNVKGVVLTHRNLMSVVAGMYAVREERAEPSVLLLTVPMFHAYGFVYCLKAAAMGETVVVVEGRFEVERMMKAVEEFAVTHVATAPPVVVAMAKGEVADRYAVRSLERTICGGAPLRTETIEWFKARFPNVLLQQGYALTETTGVAFRMVGPEEISHLGSVGRLVPYSEAKIVDPGTGITQSPCMLGELWIRGPLIMKGYLGDESATAATINSDGWLKTGDLCYIDNDGFLFVVDRLKELIKYNGYQVPPAELEQLLLTHPEITEAAVIPYPDEEAGQVPMAFVVRRPNSNLNEAQIMEFVARQVAPYKKIRRVSFINSIPKNPSGKLLRKDLVKLATSSSGSPSSRL
ncbi:4-coumarate--CoA ligase-like protein 9 [Cinnamomum micranthum f. kanehirae]|uniref:4-coumarate--CoA ligase-like protein 9 n=1 Tax=Cinnamomum micranthum f. kanehirae TaxID=337451 RepID=A0A443Q1I5_9MAGN|nr:4-coumarate--CoA ligase-like protein 9 [Cinnamomum micranthum f. kanehirae]